VTTIAKTADMMCPAVADHHLTTAYLAFRLAQELDRPIEEQRDMAVAGALHDIGAFSLQERLDLLEFEYTNPTEHSLAGYLLLKDFPSFARVAPIIKHHHVPWDHGAGHEFRGEPVLRGSHLLQLADRMAVLVPGDRTALVAARMICDTVANHAGTTFVPEFTDAARRLADRDYVWLEVSSGAAEHVLRRELAAWDEAFDLDSLLALARVICRSIDFKSAFTATHSRGVVATSARLARIIGFSEDECRKIEAAAYLHDIGKLAVPTEILEKPARLDKDEWPIMRSHVYYSYQALESIEALREITPWSAFHHERLNASGYPFGYDEEQIPTGARVIAVADVFTGITENRPYRKGMLRGQAQALLEDMVGRNELDGMLVETLLIHYEELNVLREKAQDEAAAEYEAFRKTLDDVTA
jgi:HD-GYP domain-containing protein (c-di-GMP phosphodiesterase class II)